MCSPTTRKDRAADKAIYAYTRKQHQTAEDVHAYDAEGNRRKHKRLADLSTAEQLSETETNPIKIRYHI